MVWNAATGTAYVGGSSGALPAGPSSPTPTYRPGGRHRDAFVMASSPSTRRRPRPSNSYTVAEGGTLNGNVITDNTGAGVDSDPDGDPLTASLVDGPLHGSLILNADGSFTYTPYDPPTAATLPTATASPTRSATARAAPIRRRSASPSRPTRPTRRRSTACPARRASTRTLAGLLRGQRQPHPAARRRRRQHDRADADRDQRHGHAAEHDRSHDHRRANGTGTRHRPGLADRSEQRARRPERSLRRPATSAARRCR